MGLLSTPIGLGVKAVRGLMDMSTPARMARAKEQGFDTDTKWYHGTSVDADPKTGLPFKEFDSSLLGSSSGAKDTRHGFYFAKNRSTADAYRPTSEVINKKKFESEYGLSIDDAQKQKSNSMDELSFWGLSDKEIQPLRSPKNVEKLPDYMKDSGWDYSATNRKLNPATYTSNRQYRPSEWISEVKEGSNFSVNLNTSNFKEVDMGGSSWDANIQDSIAKEAKLDGYEGVIFKNMQDSGWFGGSGVDDIALAFETKNIRSPDAAFDPAKISSSNLLASNPVATAAAGAGGLLAVTGSEDADAGVVGKSLDNIIKAANKQGVKLDVFENKKKGGLELSRIVVPEKSKGVGTSIMNDLAEYADKTGQTVSLSPSTDFGGTSKRRLTEFYKRFGFVQNKGKNKDYTISNSMYRSPSIKSSNPVATTGAGLMASVTGQPSNLSSYMQGNTDAYLTNAERQYLQNKQAFESNFSDDTGWDRADILPFRVNEQTGEREFATPEMIKGLLSGLYDIGQSKNTKISNPASLLELI